ncbi:MAG: flagellar basal body protein FliL [Treponema sp.]|jgi:flagellar FliL protein|nr:flagellar basal body protein FliL [Treponema sp.]
MSDSEDLDLGDEDAGGLDNSSKKTSGLAALLPNLLKFIAIGLGAVVFIITVTVITSNIMLKNNAGQEAMPANSPYIGQRPQYAMFTAIGVVRTRTKDNQAVVVDMVIAYEQGNNATATELTARIVELQDFVRKFFSLKTADQVTPEKETEIKKEIIEQLNRDVLSPAKALNIFFRQLDVMKVEG